MKARLALIARYLAASLRAEEHTALLVGWPGLPAAERMPEACADTRSAPNS